MATLLGSCVSAMVGGVVAGSVTFGCIAAQDSLGLVVEDDAAEMVMQGIYCTT